MDEVVANAAAEDTEDDCEATEFPEFSSEVVYKEALERIFVVGDFGVGIPLASRSHRSRASKLSKTGCANRYKSSKSCLLLCRIDVRVGRSTDMRQGGDNSDLTHARRLWTNP